MERLFSSARKRWELVENHYSIVGRKNASNLTQLRWIAVVGQISTIAVVSLVLHIPIPIFWMAGFLIFLIAFNIASELRWREYETISNRELFLALLVDVFTLTAQLYLSGGAQNPFAFLFLLQVIISSVLLNTLSTWFILLITAACLIGLSQFFIPLQLPNDQHVIRELYARGLVICFVLNAALLTIFVTRITRNMREHETQLADLRERAVEEDHIVRMGLLASGAAHELGTPLATMSVILGDWQRMPAFNTKPEVRQDMQELQMQLERCKSIISGILLSAGEIRSESSTKTTLNTFLRDLTEDWRNSRSIVAFEFHNQIRDDVPIAFDTALKQMMFNVLDNALEASPDWVRLDARCDGDRLELTVSDAGPGFNSVMLAQFGKPYQSSKERPGRGLGIFFVVNVARKLGGTVTAANRNAQDGSSGAIVRMDLPLDSIRIREETNHVG